MTENTACKMDENGISRRRRHVGAFLIVAAVSVARARDGEVATMVASHSILVAGMFAVWRLRLDEGSRAQQAAVVLGLVGVWALGALAAVVWLAPLPADTRIRVAVVVAAVAVGLAVVLSSLWQRVS